MAGISRKEEALKLTPYESWQDDLHKIRMWHIDHPLGATTSEEKEQLQDLQLREIGAYFIYRVESKQPPIDNYARQKLSETEDWR